MPGALLTLAEGQDGEDQLDLAWGLQRVKEMQEDKGAQDAAKVKWKPLAELGLATLFVHVGVESQTRPKRVPRFLRRFFPLLKLDRIEKN